MLQKLKWKRPNYYYDECESKTHWNKFDQLCALRMALQLIKEMKAHWKKRKRNKEHQENTDHKPNKMLHSKNIQVERKLSNEFHSGWFANELFHIAWVFGIGFNLRWSLNDAKSFGQVLIDIAPFGTVLRLQMLLKARTHTHATAIGIHFKWKTFFKAFFGWVFSHVFFSSTFDAYKCGLTIVVVDFFCVFWVHSKSKFSKQ